MNSYQSKRILLEAEYIVEHKTTVRATAQVFGVGKSTVHKDMVLRLKDVNLELYYKVKDILKINLEERHIRGGLATKRKYTKLKNK